MEKEELIKKEIRDAIEIYNTKPNMIDLLNSIKESFEKHCNYKELFNLHKFILLPGASAIFYFYKGHIEFDFQPFNIQFPIKLNTLFFKEKRKKKIFEKIYNVLEKNNNLEIGIWSLIKFKDTLAFVNVLSSDNKDIPHEYKNKSDEFLNFGELTLERAWDATIL